MNIEDQSRNAQNIDQTQRGILPKEINRNKVATSTNFFIAGSIGGMAGVIAGQPLDTIKVKLQTQQFLIHQHQLQTVSPGNSNSIGIRQYKGSWDCIKVTVSRDGFLGLYKGMLSPLLGIGLQRSISFGANDTVKLFLKGNEQNKPLSLSQLVIAAAAGGASNSIILTPVDQMKIYMQMKKNALHPCESTKTLSSAARGIAKSHAKSTGHKRVGIRNYFQGLYVGYKGVLLREIPGCVIYFTTYELLSRQRRNYNLPEWFQGILGGISGSILWMCYYPLDIIKSKMQARVVVPCEVSSFRESASISHTARNIYYNIYGGGKNPGIHHFYKGITPAILRAFPTHAAVFSVYETVSRYLN